MDHIVEQTNLYAEQQKRDNPNASTYSFVKIWEPIDRKELEKFFGLLFLMGIIHKPKIRDYWSTDPLMSSTVFGAIMTRNRFQSILKFLHFNDNDRAPDPRDQNRDRLYKLRPLIDHLCDAFQNNYEPDMCVSIDESLLLWKGRLVFRQYLPLKRARFGIKLYSCCESRSGYTYRFRVYTGKEDPATQMTNDLPPALHQALSSEKTVAWLMLPLLDKGYHLFVDNYYTSIPLANYLLQRSTLMTGTIRANRMPATLKSTA